jgi:hypothetical protein
VSVARIAFDSQPGEPGTTVVTAQVQLAVLNPRPGAGYSWSPLRAGHRLSAWLSDTLYGEGHAEGAFITGVAAGRQTGPGGFTTDETGKLVIVVRHDRDVTVAAALHSGHLFTTRLTKE